MTRYKLEGIWKDMFVVCFLIIILKILVEEWTKKSLLRTADLRNKEKKIEYGTNQIRSIRDKYSNATCIHLTSPYSWYILRCTFNKEKAVSSETSVHICQSRRCHEILLVHIQAVACMSGEHRDNSQL
jgi:hypothetical protein